MNFRWCLAATAALALSCAANRSSSRPQTLVILGSSTSACARVSHPDSCYVQRLQQHYRNRGASVRVISLAVSGYDPYRAMPDGFVPPPGRARPDTAHNLSRALSYHPDLVLVNFPSNGYCDFSVPEVLSLFRRMDEEARKGGARAYFTTTQPRETACFLTHWGKARLIEINDSLQRQFGSRVIDFFTPLVNPADSSINDRYDSGDHVHVNDEGHRQLFEAAVEALPLGHREKGGRSRSGQRGR